MSAIVCPRCDRALPDWLFRDSRTQSICPECQASLEVYCFPALYRSEEKLDISQLAITEGEACCYEHPSKKAAALCSNCGRFLCGLCEVQLGSQVLCPECVYRQKGTSDRNSLETQRTNFDSIALALATWPIFTIYFTIITAPLSIGMAIYAWNRPASILRKGRWRLFATLGIAALQIALIAAGVAALIYQSRKSS